MLLLSLQDAAPYTACPQSGSVFILTTPEGADLPATASMDATRGLAWKSFDRGLAEFEGGAFGALDPIEVYAPPGPK